VSESDTDVPTVSVHDLRGLLAGGATVVDVREQDEWETARVPGVLLLPLAELPVRLSEIPPAGRVYMVCATGGRSQRAAQYLRAGGLDAVNVEGGTSGWIEAGYEVESGPAPG
jgi:rhodanese-related sulfurtransferase